MSSFELKERQRALLRAVESDSKMAPESANVNMHMHSFFSYNSNQWSPTRLAWQAHEKGLYAAGLCDFDVLDGQAEFIEAGEILGLRSSVNLETRVFVHEYSDAEMTSPGEPGVTYIMGAGFAKKLAESSRQAETLNRYRERAQERNIALIERINPHIRAIAIDYEKDVVPLTPAGTATERHIIRAYVNKASKVFTGKDSQVRFWSDVLDLSAEEAEKLLNNRVNLEDIARNKLAKRGGVGYLQPNVDTFPPADDFIDWVHSCDAIAMMTWLDGTSSGEADGKAMLECMWAKGVAAINIIPERNWNISDPKTCVIKRENLRKIVEFADDMRVPINIGTEMNRDGQLFVDDLEGPVLQAFRETFVRGSRILVGHSILLRFAGFSYVGEKSQSEFGNDIKSKNEFFESVGALPPVNCSIAESLKEIDEEKAFACICDSAKQQNWTIK